MRIFLLIPAAVFSLAIAQTALAWDGYDQKNRNRINIERGDMLNRGGNVEVYDYEDNKYKELEVQELRVSPWGVELEVYDPEKREYKKYDMDSR